MQSSNISGSFNVVVQAQGDGITVNVNYPHLILTARHSTPPQAETILDLLNPFCRAIPLVGRGTAAGGLRKWLDAEPVISVSCLVGGAGIGKTRLAIELCQAAAENDWAAGFVSHQELARFRNQQNLSVWRWPRDTLIVVDYAAARANVLREWLVELARNPVRTRKRLRLLLLERHAEPNLGWWRDLVTPGTFSEDSIGDLFSSLEPSVLPPLASGEDRREILSRIMAQASRILSKPHPMLPPAPGQNPEFDRQLGDPSVAFAPLHLSMIGITAVREGIPALLKVAPGDMAQRIAIDELSRISKLAVDRNLDSDFLKFLVAGVTLAAGISRDELVGFIPQEHESLGVSGGNAFSYERAVAAALGTEGDRVLPILPDLIGEAAILEAITKMPEQEQVRFVNRWFERWHGRVAAVLIRTAQDYGTTTDSAAMRLLNSVVDANVDVGCLWEIASQLPKDTILLRECAARVWASIVARLRASAGSEPGQEQLAILAVALNNLAIRLSELGRSDEAYACADESTGITRRLAESQPDAFRPNLAFSLRNLASRVSEIGRPKQAYDYASEAVNIYRQLASQQNAFRPDLAQALDNLAIRLGNLGRPKQAYECGKEAMEMHRGLAKSRPSDAFRTALAMSLNNLSNRSRDLGFQQEAYDYGSAAVEIYRQLAASRPDSSRFRVAGALSNLALALRDLGQLEQACACAGEAVDIYRKLTASQPDAFQAEFARSLNNLTLILDDLGRSQEACERAVEGVRIYRQLVISKPDAFRPHMAGLLNNLAVSLNNLGRWEQARDCATEAVEIYRQWTSSHPDAFRPKLAASLSTLANSLSGLGQREQALRADEEAVCLLGPMFLLNPGSFGQLMAVILATYEGHRTQFGRDLRSDLIELITQIRELLGRR